MRDIIERLSAQDENGEQIEEAMSEEDALACVTALVSVARSKARAMKGSNWKAIQSALETADKKTDDEIVRFATGNSMDAIGDLDKKIFGLIRKHKAVK